MTSSLTLRIISVLVLLTAAARADIRIINSLPATIDARDNNDTIRFNGDVLFSASGNAISFSNTYGNVDNVLIDGQGDTIVFGTAGLQYPRASNVTNGINTGTVVVDHLTIRNLHVKHRPPADSAAYNPARPYAYGTWAKCFRISNVKRSRFENVYGYVNGGNGQIIYVDPTSPTNSGYNVEFYGCNFLSQVAYFRDRQEWKENSMIQLGGPKHRRSEPDFEYHYKFVACTTSGAWWNNLHIGDEYATAFVLRIDSCKWKIDGRNDNPASNAGETYCISLRGGDSTLGAFDVASITNCTFETDSAYAGGHAIFMSGTDGADYLDTNNCIYIAHNTSNTHHGNDGGFVDAYGIKIRQDVTGFRIEHNDITVSSDYLSGTSAWHENCIGLELQVSDNGGAPKTHLNSCMNGIIRHNTIRAINRGTENGLDPEARCIQLSEWFSNAIQDIYIDSNTLITNGTFWTIGEFNGPAQGGAVIRDNLHQYLSGTSPNDNTTWMAYCAPPAEGPAADKSGRGNIFRDPTFANGVDGTHTYVNNSGTEDGPHDLTIKYTITPQVIGSNGYPVRACTLIVSNAYGQMVGYGLTNAAGKASFLVSSYFNADWTADSTAFNPFSVRAAKGTDIRTVSYNLAWNAKTPSITLTNTLGEDSLISRVDRYLIGNTTDLTINGFDPLGNPRHQTWTLSDSNSVGVYSPGGLNNGRNWISSSFNLDSTTRFVNRRAPAPTNTTTGATNHDHFVVYNDTIWHGAGDPVGGNAVLRRYAFTGPDPDSLYALPDVVLRNPHPLGARYVTTIGRLPGTDSVIFVQRNGNEPKPINISYKVSADNGATWSAEQYVIDLSGSAVTNLRIGLEPFDSTLVLLLDSGEFSIKAYKWNRGTSQFDFFGNSHQWGFNTDRFRCIGFSAYKDTILFSIHAAHGTSFPPYDSIYISRRTRGTPWVRVDSMQVGYRGLAGSVPYAAFSYAEYDQTLWLWFNGQTSAATADSQAMFISRYDEGTGRFGPRTRVSGPNDYYAWKISAAGITPASHGRQIYAQMLSRQLVGGVPNVFGHVVRVQWTGPPVDTVDTIPPAPIDTLALLRDSSATEGQYLAAVVVTFSPMPPIDFTYQYATSDYTAHAGEDYYPVSGVATVNPHRVPPVDPDLPTSTKDTIYIPIIDDALDEPNEIFRVVISAPSIAGYLGLSSDLVADVIIIDNDVPLVLGDQRNRRIRK